ncbi:MAG TPA: hypothetical protein VGR56_07935 [Nitrososphaerales archaeon]|nr:hypothetical protein [Nitrososphaerales archaeon]
MALTCSTRYLKNAKFLQGPELSFFPSEEPIDGFASLVPMHVLSRLGEIALAELEPDELAMAVSKRRPPAVGKVAVAPLFAGTLRFVQATFSSSGTDHTLPAADLGTAMGYAKLTASPISAYASQYGPNSLAVAIDTIPLQAPVVAGKYNDQSLAGWVDQLAKSRGLGPDSCLVFLNPQGVVNTDADVNQGVLGYHNISPGGIPYAFVNVLGQGLTIKDEQNFYALALSHEIVEALVDPAANGSNPEVSDNCSGNCQVEFRNYFDADGVWLGGSPGLSYEFFIAGCVKPANAGQCPAPVSACTYPPPASPGNL